MIPVATRKEVGSQRKRQEIFFLFLSLFSLLTLNPAPPPVFLTLSNGIMGGGVGIFRCITLLTTKCGNPALLHLVAFLLSLDLDVPKVFSNTRIQEEPHWIRLVVHLAHHPVLTVANHLSARELSSLLTPGNWHSKAYCPWQWKENIDIIASSQWEPHSPLICLVFF